MVSSLSEISELSLPETDIWLMENGRLINQSLETKDCNKLGTDGLVKRHMYEHKESHPVWRHLCFLLLHDFSWRDMVTFKVLCQFGEQRNLLGVCKRYEWVVNYINMGHEKHVNHWKAHSMSSITKVLSLGLPLTLQISPSLSSLHGFHALCSLPAHTSWGESFSLVLRFSSQNHDYCNCPSAFVKAPSFKTLNICLFCSFRWFYTSVSHSRVIMIEMNILQRQRRSFSCLLEASDNSFWLDNKMLTVRAGIIWPLPALETLLLLLGCLVQFQYEGFSSPYSILFVFFSCHLLGTCSFLKRKWRVRWLWGKEMVLGTYRSR